MCHYRIWAHLCDSLNCDYTCWWVKLLWSTDSVCRETRSKTFLLNHCLSYVCVPSLLKQCSSIRLQWANLRCRTISWLFLCVHTLFSISILSKFQECWDSCLFQTGNKNRVPWMWAWGASFSEWSLLKAALFHLYKKECNQINGVCLINHSGMSVWSANGCWHACLGFLVSVWSQVRVLSQKSLWVLNWSFLTFQSFEWGCAAMNDRIFWNN